VRTETLKSKRIFAVDSQEIAKPHMTLTRYQIRAFMNTYYQQQCGEQYVSFSCIPWLVAGQRGLGTSFSQCRTFKILTALAEGGLHNLNA
jgi:hypothetical protein